MKSNTIEKQLKEIISLERAQNENFIKFQEARLEKLRKMVKANYVPDEEKEKFKNEMIRAGILDENLKLTAMYRTEK